MADYSNDARPIVVGIDGSDSSYSAFREAARLAVALGAPLRAVAVWDVPRSMYDVYAPQPDWSPEGDAERSLRDAANTVLGTEWPAWFSTTVRQGGAAAALIEESKDAGMLVLGSRGHGGFVGMMLGSVSLAAVAHAFCPVLVVRHPDVDGGSPE